MKKRLLISMIALAPFALANSTPLAAQEQRQQAERAGDPDTGIANPVPLINQPLVPDAAAPGGPAFRLTVTGAGSVQGARVEWNGSPRATNFVSSDKLTAAIGAKEIEAAGTASVSVVNPGPGGGTSNTVFFPIRHRKSTVFFAVSSLDSFNVRFS